MFVADREAARGGSVRKLGGGQRLFAHHDRERGPVELRVVDSTVPDGGLVILTYRQP
jgi:hypothetical protein